MNETEIEVLEKLQSAENSKDIIDAIGKLSRSRQTPESMMLVSAAGTMLGQGIMAGNAKQKRKERDEREGV